MNIQNLTKTFYVQNKTFLTNISNEKTLMMHTQKSNVTDDCYGQD